MTHPLAPDLGDAAADFAGGRIDASQFCALFERRTVYGMRLPGRPVLAAYRIETGRDTASSVHGRTAAPVFSSLAALARWCRSLDTDPEQVQEVDWYAVTGGDLLDAWPPSCALVIDPGSGHCIAHPQPMRLDVTITVKAAAGMRAG